MNRRIIILILIILALGVLYRLIVTSNGHFLFNMDNGRDMVDVREMVVLKKLRLTGPNSAIEGLFNGPAWYYLLAIPFILSGGDPYASILMEISFWVIGGFFLLNLVSKWGKWLIFPIGILWVASNYILLTTAYAFNPNPVTLLTPLFIYLLSKYLETKKVVFSVLVWILAGLFFNFEMNFGIFTPLIILISIFLTKKYSFLKQKSFWVGIITFSLFLLPQVLFDLKHQFIMTKAVTNFLKEGSHSNFDVLKRLQSITGSFFNTFVPTLMNHKILAYALLLFSVPVFKKFFQSKEKDLLVLISALYILIPFIGYLILPVSVNPWHLGGSMAASLIIIGYVLAKLLRLGIWGTLVSIILATLIVIYGLTNIANYFFIDRQRPDLDPSSYKNEISAIDYVYKYANGENFKVYTYLPSVIDYPYQYLFWWYGQKMYGYIPGEYAYSPNKPQYISNKEKFEGRKDNFSGLVFLIKEPDGIGYRGAWEDDFKKMQFISKEWVGPLEVEIRKEL